MGDHLETPVIVGTSTPLTLSPPEGPYSPTVFIENCEFSGGKAFRVWIDLKGYGHSIYLLLIESLIMIPPGKRRSTLGFPVMLNFKRVKLVPR